ncbi:MAG: nucleotidyltransferase domain-containing protein [Deltaproteobacteria bacterium]|nr:nucleotidyltransferase domain-containing protein [Deltaproteobacteria bacterium]
MTAPIPTDDSAFAATWRARREAERASAQVHAQALAQCVVSGAAAFLDAFPSATLWLIGSVAAGTARADSDLDLVVSGLDATAALQAERWWQDRLRHDGLRRTQVDLQRGEELPEQWLSRAVRSGRRWPERAMEGR